VPLAGRPGRRPERLVKRLGPGKRATVIPSPPYRHMASRSRQSSSQNTGAQEWLRFYERALRYIIEINKQGDMTDIEGPDNGLGEKTELVILEPATATILGLLYKCVPGGRIQIISEKHTGKKSYRRKQNLQHIFPRFAICLVKFEIDTMFS
jgi:hypothetical protein